MVKQRCMVGATYMPRALVAQLRKEAALEEEARKIQSFGGGATHGESEEDRIMSRKRHRKTLRNKARHRGDWH